MVCHALGRLGLQPGQGWLEAFVQATAPLLHRSSPQVRALPRTGCACCRRAAELLLIIKGQAKD